MNAIEQSIERIKAQIETLSKTIQDVKKFDGLPLKWINPYISVVNDKVSYAMTVSDMEKFWESIKILKEMGYEFEEYPARNIIGHLSNNGRNSIDTVTVTVMP